MAEKGYSGIFYVICFYIWYLRLISDKMKLTDIYKSILYESSVVWLKRPKYKYWAKYGLNIQV